jgi:hypothetical protein
MEKRLNKRIEQYVIQFKDDLRKQITEINFEEKDKINGLMEYIYEYNRLILTKTDFVKRKREKNIIPDLNRCNARRANGEQCTRRRKENCCFCGTHQKDAPHGLMDSDTDTKTTQTLEVFPVDIKGIIYYLDNYNNIYKVTDILALKENPTIIGKYVKRNEEYILEFL